MALSPPSAARGSGGGGPPSTLPSARRYCRGMAATRLRVNGVDRRVTAPANRTLLSVLRDELDLTGTKYGCGQAACGACTVLLDGEAVRSCITKVGTVGHRRGTTLEGAGTPPRPHPPPQALLPPRALPGGYGPPGVLRAAAGLLAATPDPSEAEVREGLAGNVCRCGTYPRIVAAVRQAAAAMRRK